MRKKEKGRKEKKVFLRANTVANLKKILEVERLLEVFFWCLLSKLGFRALALKNANAIFKAFLIFQGSKTLVSNNDKPHYCKNFCNSATVQF